MKGDGKWFVEYVPSVQSGASLSLLVEISNNDAKFVVSLAVAER